jgi:ribose/xylose/arabinose/galactoside ABC-type transport system permease subunit/ABC-type multidrug transport system ATPase subunit
LLGAQKASGDHIPRHTQTPGESARRVGLAVLLGALLLLFGLLYYPRFWTTADFLTILLNSAAIGIAAIGAAALLITGNVDLSIGGEFALISVVLAVVERDTQNVPLAIAVGLVAGVALGFINGFLVRLLKISPIIVTLGTMSIYAGFAFVVTGGLDVYNFSSGFLSFGVFKVGPVQLETIIAAVIFTIGGLLLTRTVPGLHAYAIGGNRDAARYNGIKVDRIVLTLYVMMGLLMGIVSVLETARLGSATADVGTTTALDALTAVLLGGVSFLGGSGSPVGVALGVVTIGVINAGLIFAGLSDWWQQIAKGALLLLALGADQYALYRRRLRTRAVADEVPAESLGLARISVAAHSPQAQAPGDGARAASHPAFACRGLTKSYGALMAVQDVTFEVKAGEVVGLVGDNGAGKSTVVKMIAGAITPDKGFIEVDGQPTGHFRDPGEARRIGVECVFQDLAVCPNLNVAHNVVLGDEPRRRLGPLRLRDDRTAFGVAKARLDRLGIQIGSMASTVRYLSGGQRQCVAVARVLKADSRLVLLDEPTAALGVNQTRIVLGIARAVADQGAGVILVSHDVESVFAVADRAVVLRHGRKVHDGPISALGKSDLLHLMAGFSLDQVREPTR